MFSERNRQLRKAVNVKHGTDYSVGKVTLQAKCKEAEMAYMSCCIIHEGRDVSATVPPGLQIPTGRDHEQVGTDLSPAWERLHRDYIFQLWQNMAEHWSQITMWKRNRLERPELSSWERKGQAVPWLDGEVQRSWTCPKELILPQGYSVATQSHIIIGNN